MSRHPRAPRNAAFVTFRRHHRRWQRITQRQTRRHCRGIRAARAMRFHSAHEWRGQQQLVAAIKENIHRLLAAAQVSALDQYRATKPSSQLPRCAPHVFHRPNATPQEPRSRRDSASTNLPMAVGPFLPPPPTPRAIVGRSTPPLPGPPRANRAARCAGSPPPPQQFPPRTTSRSSPPPVAIPQTQPRFGRGRFLVCRIRQPKPVADFAL